jgi:hypothetical protein
MELLMKSLRDYLFVLMLASVNSSVYAKWEKVSEANAADPEMYIEMESVKQAGPMSIYRQVKVLSQGPSLNLNRVGSKVELYEYDCMNSKLRILQVAGYSQVWATGEAVNAPPLNPEVREWQDLPKSQLGLPTFNMLCPSGKDD